MKVHAFLLSVLLMPLYNCNSSSSAQTDSGNKQTPADIDNVSTENNSATTQTASLKNDAAGKTRFGVMVAKTSGQNIPPEKQIVVARALGVNYIRGRIDIKAWNGSNPAYDAYTGSGLKVVLNINYGVPRDAMGEKDPVPFPADMAAYKKSLNAILDRYKPEVVVIENEEDNPGYHAGSADDYINELKTGIEVAHSKGLKVTNGGITVREVSLIVYDDYMQRGEKQKAKDFAQRAFPDVYLQRLNNLNNPMVKRQLEFGRKIIAAYKTLDLDYVNFHWYEPVKARGAAGAGMNETDFDPATFTEVATFLKKATGKPVMSNEFGVFNSSGKMVKNLLQTVADADLSYAIFYSADGGTGKAVALQNAGGDLRESGKAFRDFVKEHQ